MSNDNSVQAPAETDEPPCVHRLALRRLWDTLSDLELAVIALGIPDLVDGWGEPRHRSELGVKVTTDAGTVYRLYDAYAQANAIMNDGELYKSLFSITPTSGDRKAPPQDGRLLE